jgi:parallel beta-helix repeat protein
MTRPKLLFGSLFLLPLFTLAPVASAKTLCVSQHPHPGCPYSTIGSAVAAASPGDIIQVTRGTYSEDVVIGKAITITGTDGHEIINAAGLSNGIYIDGLDNPGLAAVVVSGLKIQNAKYEGLLITNASAVTVSGNQVVHNDIGLDIADAACPGIYAFETAEGFDCGEGIHLSGVDHSIIANNQVENNSGGILLSDDTGATHDNLILDNTVAENPLDCGITLASHPMYSPISGPPTAAGVYHNTITGNVSQHNGYEVPGAGAGVGLFSPAPFTKTYGNVVVGNYLKDNGLPGVAFHAHAPGADLNDNVVANNTIIRNGADTADTVTPGTTGINVSGGDNGSGAPLAVITGTLIAGNTIQQEDIGVVTKTGSFTSVNLNNFFGLTTGVDNLNGGAVGAQLNWWGCFGGPTAPGCANVQGSNVFFTPFLPFPNFPDGDN